MPIDSKRRKAVVPVASCVSVWSIRMPMGCPASRLPSTRWFWSILYISVFAIAFFHEKDKFGILRLEGNKTKMPV